MIAIHIGLRKCGSSTLQNFFADNRKNLLRHSIDYSAAGLSHSNHHRIAREIRKFSGPESESPFLDSLVDCWRDSRGTTLVVSAEIFEEAAAEGINYLNDNLRRSRAGEEIRVIMYLRDLVELMPSSYAQKIKLGKNTHDFDSFFESRMWESRVNYFETAARWANVFGWQNLRVRVLDREFLLNGNLIDDFLGQLDISVDSDAISKLDRTVVRNQRPDWRVLEATRALYTQNHRRPGKHPVLEAAKKVRHSKVLGRLAIEAGASVGWNEDRGRFLTRSQAQRCSAIYGSAIDALNEYLVDKLPAPPDLGARGFVAREFMPSAECIPHRELSAFYDRLAELWYLNESRRPVDWVMRQKELGAELLAQGRSESGKESIETLANAVAALCAALRVLAEDRMPMEWATTQDDLGDALFMLGQRCSSNEGLQFLAQSASSYRASLRVRSESGTSLEWAATQTKLGNALAALGERGDAERREERLLDACTAFADAKRVFTAEREPARHAALQSSLAQARSLMSAGRRPSR